MKKNTEITFGIHPETQIIEYDSKQNGARLYAQACGLDIYIISEDSTRHPDCLANMMMNACLSRHIPIISLRLVSRTKATIGKKRSNTSEMF